MNVEEALVTLDTALKQQGLTDIQELVFRQAWLGQTYSEMAESCGYDANYIKDVGSKLWKLLSKALEEEVTKNNFHSALRRRNASLRLDYDGDAKGEQRTRSAKTRSDWGEVVDVPVFYGRAEELNILKQWIVGDRCRLVALLDKTGAVLESPKQLID